MERSSDNNSDNSFKMDSCVQHSSVQAIDCGLLLEEHLGVPSSKLAHSAMKRL